MSSGQAGASDTARAFRDCVGGFATGVTVVTTIHGGQYAGLTVNAFASVSLDPMLVLVSLDHGSRTLERLRASSRFCISVLGRDQADTARAFARSGQPFPVDLVIQEPEGFLAVKDALAVLRCETYDTVAAGDHDLVIGRVLSFDARGGEPLLFWKGTFGRLSADCVNEVAEREAAQAT